MFSTPPLAIRRVASRVTLATKEKETNYQRWSRGHKAPGQGQGHRKIRGKDTPSEDRSSLGQGQECSRPRTKDINTEALTEKKVLRPKICKFFIELKRSPKKKVFKNFFLQVLLRAPRKNNIAHDLGQFSTSQKIVLSSSREQGIFEDLQGSRPRPKT